MYGDLHRLLNQLTVYWSHGPKITLRNTLCVFSLEMEICEKSVSRLNWIVICISVVLVLLIWKIWTRCSILKKYCTCQYVPLCDYYSFAQRAHGRLFPCLSLCTCIFIYCMGAHLYVHQQHNFLQPLLLQCLRKTHTRWLNFHTVSSIHSTSPLGEWVCVK